MATTTKARKRPPTAEQLAEKIENWFPKFKAEHLARCYRNDWPEHPEAAKTFWDMWKNKIRRCGASYDEATEASEDVAGMNPVPYPSDQLGVLLKFIGAIHKRLNNEQMEARSADIQEAKNRTDPNCECGRNGLVIRYRHASVREGKGTDAAGTQYVCHCVCPVGQWMRLNLEPENRRLFVNLAAYPALQVRSVSWSDTPDNPFRYHPDRWDADMQCPVAATSKWREHVNLFRAEGMESLRRYMLQHEPRPHVSRRTPTPAAAYREPTPEEVANADNWKQHHLPPAPQSVAAEASPETPPF